jgi:hypothetical protein
MAVEEDTPADRPIAAPEGTWPLDEWPIDVQRTDASGNVDLSQIEYMLSLTPAQRLERLEQFVASMTDIWKAKGIAWSSSNRSSAD